MFATLGLRPFAWVTMRRERLGRQGLKFLSQFDRSATGVLCHNAHFDGFILSHHYKDHPAFFACTLAMAHECYPGQHASLEALAKKFGLPPKTVRYIEMDGLPPDEMSEELVQTIGKGAEHDCALTRTLADGFPPGELPIVSMTAQMFMNPQLVGDAEMLWSLQQSELDKREALLESLKVTAKDLGSSTKFQATLGRRGRIGATRTGRWSGGDKANWPGELSKCISAPEGSQLVICDASQIEYRTLCAVAGEQWPLDAFREERDVYCEQAAAIFKRPITEEDVLRGSSVKKQCCPVAMELAPQCCSSGFKGEGVNITEEQSAVARPSSCLITVSFTVITEKINAKPCARQRVRAVIGVAESRGIWSCLPPNRDWLTKS
jgi:hypothetical protein